MRITAAGDVGIGGTPSSAYKLDVTGDILARGGNLNVSNGGSASGTSMYSPAANELGISTNGVEAIRITSGGQVHSPIVTTTTTVSSGGAASYAVDFNGANLQKLILDASLTDLTFTSSNLAAGRTVTLLLDLVTNSVGLNSVSAPSWAYFVNDLNSHIPSYGYALIKLTSWGTTDGAVTAEVLDSTT